VFDEMPERAFYLILRVNDHIERWVIMLMWVEERITNLGYEKTSRLS